MTMIFLCCRDVQRRSKKMQMSFGLSESVSFPDSNCFLNTFFVILDAIEKCSILDLHLMLQHKYKTKMVLRYIRYNNRQA